MRHLIIAAALLPFAAAAQPVASSYTTRDGRAATVVITCPSSDGSYTAAACSLAKNGPTTYAAANATAIATANTAVTIFTAGSIASGCDIINTAAAPLFIDFTTTAVIGAATAIPLQPGQSYHCAFPPAGAVSAVAAQPQAFAALRY